ALLAQGRVNPAVPPRFGSRLGRRSLPRANGRTRADLRGPTPLRSTASRATSAPGVPDGALRRRPRFLSVPAAPTPPGRRPSVTRPSLASDVTFCQPPPALRRRAARPTGPVAETPRPPGALQSVWKGRWDIVRERGPAM
ncbi:MAG: hypothetical protein AVDCRST_MAG19-4311, partial [uncultured Thermomicrobiales bacterium]